MRHRFVASYAYDLPFGKASRWLKGWQTFGILQFQTGRPFTVALLPDFDNSNTGIDSLGFGANNRPNVVGNPQLSNPRRRVVQYLGFRDSALRHLRQLRPQMLEGPGSATVDLSLVKNTAIREKCHGAVPRRDIQCIQSHEFRLAG